MPVLLFMAAPPTVIALDTATEYCSVAIAHGAKLVQSEVEAGQSHSRRLLPLLQHLLDDVGLALGDTDGIAFGAGPGSFTGLRIACGAAQGLAYGLDLPVIPVGNLEALAAAAQELEPGARRIGVALDARMNEAYWAVYACGPDGLHEIAAPALARFSELAQTLERFSVDAAAGNAFALTAAPTGVRALPAVRASAGVIARIARSALSEGNGVAAHLAAPLYVRDRVAQTVDERRVARSAA